MKHSKFCCALNNAIIHIFELGMPSGAVGHPIRTKTNGPSGDDSVSGECGSSSDSSNDSEYESDSKDQKKHNSRRTKMNSISAPNAANQSLFIANRYYEGQWCVLPHLTHISNVI